jgi:Tol biopolymer transport system component
MKRIALVVLALALVVAGLAAQDLERLFKAGVNSETVDRDCKAAIEQYKKVAAGNNRALAAQALIRMAGCYQQLDDPQWRTIDQEVIAKYPDQKVAVEQARERLGVTAPRQTVVSKIWSGVGSPDVSPSVDGRFLVSRVKNGLVFHDIVSNTDRTVPLGGDGGFGFPRVTPDGKRVIFGGWSDKLRIANLDGTGMRTLVDSDEYVLYEIAGISTDSKLASIGLQRRDKTWQIGLVSLETGDLKILKNLDWRDTYVGDFSPDGRWLVYSAQDSKDPKSDRAVYVIATDGSTEPSVIVPNGVDDDTPRFTPDGARVAFATQRSGRTDLWSVRVKDGKRAGEPEIAKANIGSGRGMGFDQSGAYYFAESVDSGAVYVADVDPSTWMLKNAPARISDPLRHERVVQARWSPDGKRLAYVGFPIGPLAPWRLAVHDFDSGRERELPTGKDTFALGGWFPDGKSLVVGFYASASAPASCQLINTETKEIRPLSQMGGQCPQVSADGKAAFYITRDSEPYANGQAPAVDTVRLVRKDLENGAVKELFHAESKGGSARVTPPSPDGRSLVFRFTPPDDKSPRHVIVPLSGGEPRELLGYDDPWSNWTQDSRALLFVRAGGIWVQPIDGREPYATGITFKELGNPSVSPDGGRVAFTGFTSTNNVWVIRNLFPETSAAKR